MNKTMSDFARKTLKELLSQCTDNQQLFFKRMYSHNNLERTIEDCINMMDESKLDHAISQCERTIEKNNKPSKP